MAVPVIAQARSGQGHSVVLGAELGPAVKPLDEPRSGDCWRVQGVDAHSLSPSVFFAGCTPCTILSRDPAPSQSASPPTAARQNVPSLPSWHTGAKAHSPCSGRWVVQSAENAQGSQWPFQTFWFAMGCDFLCRHCVTPVMMHQKWPFPYKSSRRGRRKTDPV